MPLKDHKIAQMPSPPKFTSLLGPSFILLGLGLGSGEIILWPYLTSNFGMGIIWGAVLGITLQFFINMEIERYSLLRGESIFVGFARKVGWAPVWFIVSTFIGFVWPGIVASSAVLISKAFGFSESHFVAMGMLVLMGLILTAGKVLYKTMEKFSMLLIGLGVPAIFGLAVHLAEPLHWQALLNGLAGFGDGYRFLPKDIPLASFLAAFAFSGAGGNLNLAQSFYIKEKGYGMGKYGGRITSILSEEVESIELEGSKFPMTGENVQKFKKWWKLINWEHAIVFWATGALSICFLGLLAFATTTKGNTSGLTFVLSEAEAIARLSSPMIGTFFLVIGGLMLFSTQMTVMDATSRIMAENLLILKRHVWGSNLLPKIYYSFLWAQILLGIIIFTTNFREPLFLLTLAAVINALAMFVHIGATLILNVSVLEREVKPSLFRVGAMLVSFAFFGYFTFKVILNYFI